MRGGDTTYASQLKAKWLIYLPAREPFLRENMDALAAALSDSSLRFDPPRESPIVVITSSTQYEVVRSGLAERGIGIPVWSDYAMVLEGVCHLPPNAVCFELDENSKLKQVYFLGASPDVYRRVLN